MKTETSLIAYDMLCQDPKHLPPLTFFLRAAKKKERAAKDTFKVGVISTFTTSGLSEVLRVMARAQKIPISVYETSYNQYSQEILLHTSQLYVHKPQLIFFLTDPSSLLRGISKWILSTNNTGLNQFITNAIFEISHFLDTLTMNSSAKVIFSLIPTVPQSTLGILENVLPSSQTNIIARINSEIMKKYSATAQVKFFDMNRFIQMHGFDKVHDHKLYLMGNYFVSPQIFPQLAYELVGYIKAINSKSRKCIVVDLDDTLWGGIVGEDGVKGIRLGETPPGNAYVDFQNTLLQFYHRGVILAINSNNNESDVDEVFTTHPSMVLKREHFASVRINWRDKAANIKSIAQELNIGLDSMVYVDDDPKKRAMMRQLAPQVLTLEVPSDPSFYSSMLVSLNDFSQESLTEVDKKRGKLYYEQSQRKTLEQKSISLTDYLKSLQIEIVFVPVSPFTIPRIAQLTQRTNQFNMTTRRYSESDIEIFSKDSHYKLYAVEVVDKFGTYGIVGTLIAKKADAKSWLIDTLLLSCRVLGLSVEHVLLVELLKFLKQKNAELIVGEFIQTPKNAPAKEFYKSVGFKLMGKSSKKNTWTYLVKDSLKSPSHIKIKYGKN